MPGLPDFTLNGGWPQLVQNEVRQGKVKVVYRAFETATRDPSTFQTQQVAALAAGKQNRFWNYTELFYHEQGAEGTGYVNETLPRRPGQADPGPQRERVAHRAQRPGAGHSGPGRRRPPARPPACSGTPTLIVKGPKGTVPVQSSTGVPSYSEIQQAIKAAGG